MEKERKLLFDIGVYIGIIEKTWKLLYDRGRMEKKMETFGLIGLYRDILGLYWANGRENGNYYLGFRA